jgi:hypothetical protein
MKKLLSIIILSFLSYSLVQADDRVTKVEIIKTSTKCLVWKGQEDLLLKRNFYFSDQYLITSHICGEKDENQGWFEPDYLINSEEIIGTNGVEISKECNNTFHLTWSNDKKIQYLDIYNLKNNQNLVICGWEYADGSFYIDQDLTENEKFLEIKFHGRMNEYHIYLIDNFDIKPLIFIFHRDDYTMVTNDKTVQLEPAKKYNLSSMLEKHFDIKLENKDLTIVPN